MIHRDSDRMYYGKYFFKLRVEGLKNFTCFAIKEINKEKMSYIDPELREIRNILDSIKDKRIACSYSSLSIYANDLITLRKIGDFISSNDNVSRVFMYSAVKSDGSHLEKNTIVLKNKIPFKYRVTLGNAKNIKSFYTFAVNNPSLVKVSSTVLDKIKNNHNVEGRYIYVKDDKSLMLSKMSLNNIRRVDRLVFK